MIDALIAGRVIGQPASRTAKNGSPFAIAKVRAADSKGETVIISVISFSRTAVQALLALSDGDSVALAGELSVGTYTDKNGQARPSLDLMVHAALTEYAVSRKRQAMQQKSEPVAAAAITTTTTDPEFDDALPF